MAAAVEYIPKNSPIHRLNPLTKMFWALFVLVGGLMFSDYRYLLALLLSVMLVAAAGRILKELLPVTTGLSVFALILLLIQALFFDQGQVLFYLIPVKNSLPVTDQGLLSGFAMALRMMTMIVSFMVLMATTQTRDMILTLVERLKIPYDYAFMFMTAIRFVPTFLAEAGQITEAQRARGYAVEGWNPVKKIKAYAPVAVPLVLISLNKAENMAMSMETRGYSGGRRTYLREPKMLGADYCLMAVMVLLLACSVAIRVSGYGAM